MTFTAGLGASPLGVGAILASVIYVGDHLCGADYNPAVSIGVLLRYGLLVPDWWKSLVVALSQLAGGIMAGFLAYLCRGSVHFPGPDPAHGGGGPVVFEMLWTALLVYAVCACTTQITEAEDPGNARKGHSRSYHGLVIGMVMAVGAYCSGDKGSRSGGVFNPALGTGIGVAAIAEGSHSDMSIWVYWVGPLCGALLGGGIFHLLHTHVDVMEMAPLMEEEDIYQPPFDGYMGGMDGVPVDRAGDLMGDYDPPQYSKGFT